jgi:hypothetical protein
MSIFYDGEYSFNYYIWLIINERSKQCVLPVPAAQQHFFSASDPLLSQEVADSKINVQSACDLNTMYNYGTIVAFI